MHIATTQSTTTDIIVNLRRFLNYPFRELSFGVDMMGGALDDHNEFGFQAVPHWSYVAGFAEGRSQRFWLRRSLTKRFPSKSSSFPSICTCLIAVPELIVRACNCVRASASIRLTSRLTLFVFSAARSAGITSGG